MSRECIQKEIIKILSTGEKISKNNLNSKVISQCGGNPNLVDEVLQQYVERGFIRIGQDPDHSQKKIYSIVPEPENFKKRLVSLAKDEVVKTDHAKFLKHFQNKKRLTKRDKESVFEYGITRMTAYVEAITYLSHLATANYFGVSVAEKSIERLDSKIKQKEQLAIELNKVDPKIFEGIMIYVQDEILNREFRYFK